MAPSSLKEKLDKIRSPNLQNQKQVSYLALLYFFLRFILLQLYPSHSQP